VLGRVEVPISEVERLVDEGVQSLLFSLEVDELFLNDQFLTIVKYVHYLILIMTFFLTLFLCLRKPWMLQSLVNGQSLFGVSSEQTLNDISSLCVI
jgi:hypothetical protein